MQETTRTLAERYELGPTIGEGGMGRVHRGFDRALGRPVAVKILAPPNDRDRAFVERFRREARSAARLSHPNVVAVFDTGSDGGTEFIVTELVEGETLRDALRRDGPLPPARAVEIARGICRALEAAHGLGVVHRDVKPGNVMLTEGGVKVLDFGIARAAEGESLTRTGSLLGSAPYVAPEQAEGAPGDERSDLYALGCVLFEMLTGRPPFVGATPIAVLYQHANEPPPPLAEVAEVPAGLRRVVDRLLAKDPADRFASASAVEAALLEALDEDTVPLRPLDGPDTVPIGPDTVPIGPDTVPIGPDTLPLPAPDPGEGTGAAPEPRRRWPAIVGGVALLALAGAIALVALGRDGGASVERVEVPSFAVAYDDLVRSIGTARAEGAATQAAAARLEERASAIRLAARAGDAEAVAGGVDGFARALARMAGSDALSFGAAATVADAFERSVAALELAPPPGASPVVSPPPTTSAPEVGVEEEGDEGSGNGGGHGPPPHANAGGNGKGKGGD